MTTKSKQKTERYETLDELRFYEQLKTRLHPQYYPGHSSAPTALLRSSVFALSERSASHSAELPAFDDLTDLTDGATVTYKGEALTQADLRVLLGVLARAKGKDQASAVVEFDATEFLADIGRATCSRSVAALIDSLGSLRSATFTVRNHGGAKGRVFGLIDEFEWDKRQVRVKLSAALHSAAQEDGRTYVPLHMRKQLADGVQTALADVLLASNTGRLEYAALAKLWRRDNVKALGVEVRVALDKLQSVGFVESWEAGRGAAHVVKAKLH